MQEIFTDRGLFLVSGQIFTVTSRSGNIVCMRRMAVTIFAKMRLIDGREDIAWLASGAGAAEEEGRHRRNDDRFFFSRWVCLWIPLLGKGRITVRDVRDYTKPGLAVSLETIGSPQN